MPSAKSDPGSTTGGMSPRGIGGLDTNDDMHVFTALATSPSIFSFRNCSAPGCSNTSAFAVWDCMTLRCGFGTCTAHTTAGMVGDRVEETEMPANLVAIFYDVEITQTSEIEQISAAAMNGKHFDTYIRTTVRRHNSPIIGQIPPMLYTLTAVEPKAAMDHLIDWVTRTSAEISGGLSREEDVIMVAHGGSKHDHVLILKAMMKWGINPPRWRFADTLPLYKIVICPNDKASLTDLVGRYAPWFDHTPHDALSDARGLMNVVLMSVTNPVMMLYVFSSDYETFVTSVGLNAFRIRSMVPFPMAPGTRA